MDKKKKLYLIGAVVGIAIVGVLIYFAATYLPRLQTGKEIEDALKPVLEAENQSMKLDIIADINGEAISFDGDIYLIKEDDTNYFVLEQDDFTMYIVDNVLFLENGKAFKIAEQMQTQVMEYDNLFLKIAAAYEMFDITRTENETEISYDMIVTGEQMKELLSAVVPTEDDMSGNIESLQVTLVTKEAKIDRIELSGSASATDVSAKIEVTISEFQTLAEGEYEIPQLIKDSVKTVDKDALFSLSEDLYRLLMAMNQFADENDIKGTVLLTANCGAIQLNKQVDLAQLKAGVSDVANPADVQALPGMIGFLCLEGDISCVENNGAYVYTLSLNQESMKKIASSIAPEIVNYVVNLTVGVAEVTVENENVSTMRIDIRGRLNLLITELPVEVGAEFIFE